MLFTTARYSLFKALSYTDNLLGGGRCGSTCSWCSGRCWRSGCFIFKKIFSFFMIIFKSSSYWPWCTDRPIFCRFIHHGTTSSYLYQDKLKSQKTQDLCSQILDLKCMKLYNLYNIYIKKRVKIEFEALVSTREIEMSDKCPVINTILSKQQNLEPSSR